jgi:bifunctional DNA-binding transcriptional regulator/antitoxin component of YhaV-PrlF toxin-antitoxin module
MTTTLKAKKLVIPASIQRRARFKAGDQLEFKATPGIITIVSTPPNAEGEYTPEQRRLIAAQVDEGLQDVRKGRMSRRFDTVDEMLASLKAKKAPRRQKSRSR